MKIEVNFMGTDTAGVTITDEITGARATLSWVFEDPLPGYICVEVVDKNGEPRARGNIRTPPRSRLHVDA